MTHEKKRTANRGQATAQATASPSAKTEKMNRRPAKSERLLNRQQVQVFCRRHEFLFSTGQGLMNLHHALAEPGKFLDQVGQRGVIETRIAHQILGVGK